MVDIPPSSQATLNSEGTFATGRPIVTVSGAHVFAGTYDTNGVRVIDHLNDPDSDFLRLKNARWAPSLRGPLEGHEGDMVLPTEQLDLVLILDTAQEAENYRYRIVSTTEVQTVAAIGRFLIRGWIHLPEKASLRPDPVWFLTRQVYGHFPITDAEVTCVGTDEPAQRVPVAIVKASRVCMLAIQSPDQPPPQFIAPTTPRYRSVMDELLG